MLSCLIYFTQLNVFLCCFPPCCANFFLSLREHVICWSASFRDKILLQTIGMICTHFVNRKNIRCYMCFLQTVSMLVLVVVEHSQGARLNFYLPGLISQCFISVRKDVKWNRTDTLHCTPACFHTHSCQIQLQDQHLSAGSLTWQTHMDS